MGVTSSESVNQIRKNFGDLRGQRGTLESQWQEAAELGSPRDGTFTQHRTEGQDLRVNQFDTMAERTLDRATAFYGSILTPRDQQWHKLRTTNPFLNKIHNVRLWYDLATEILFHWRYRPAANFATHNHEEHRSLLAWGNSCLFTGESFAQPFWYKAMHMSQVYWSENNTGIVDTVYHYPEMTKRQLVMEYGENSLPESIVNSSSPEETKHRVIHVVMPNPDFDPENRLDPLRRQFISIHMLESVQESEKDDGHILRAGGFFTFPYGCTRDARVTGEPYGRGTFQKILPDIKMTNQMTRTYIRTGQFHAEPVTLMRDDSSIDTVDLRPGRNVVGGIDAQGRPTIAPYNGGSNWEINVEMIERQGNIIEQAFLLDMFLAAGRFEGRERVTATEVLEFTREQGRLETPLAGRSENEARSPQINRELQIAMDRGLLPPMPPELVEAQGEFEIEFTNPLALAQKTDAAIGAIRVVDQAIEKAQSQPDVLDNVDLDEFMQIIHEAEGAPHKLMRDPDARALIRQARQEQQQLQQMAEAAPGVGRAVLDVSKAEQVTEGAPAA